MSREWSYPTMHKLPLILLTLEHTAFSILFSLSLSSWTASLTPGTINRTQHSEDYLSPFAPKCDSVSCPSIYICIQNSCNQGPKGGRAYVDHALVLRFPKPASPSQIAGVPLVLFEEKVCDIQEYFILASSYDICRWSRAWETGGCYMTALLWYSRWMGHWMRRRKWYPRFESMSLSMS